MKRICIIVTLFLLLAPLAQGAEGAWAGFRPFFQALRDTNTMIENTLTFISAYNPPVGTTIHVTNGLESADYDEMALRMSRASGGYSYMLEVWTKRSETWLKAMEFSFNDANNGEFVWHPYALVSTYTQGTMDRYEYNHTAQGRSAVWDVQFADSRPDLDRMRASISDANNLVSVYITVHLKTNVSGTSTADAYLMGGLISTADTNYRATLKCGAEDIGDSYNDSFNLWTVANPNNAALFSVDGFQTDGNSDGSWEDQTWPDPATLDAAQLPAASLVTAISIAFQNPGDTPDFI